MTAAPAPESVFPAAPMPDCNAKYALIHAIAATVAESRYTAWNDRAGVMTWQEFSTDDKHAGEANSYFTDGARDAEAIVTMLGEAGIAVFDHDALNYLADALIADGGIVL